MPLPPQIAELAHNKPVLIGAAAAAGLGLLVRSRNRRAPSDSATPVATSASASPTSDGSGVPSTYPNTYGTDLASALGNIDSKYADQIQAFRQQLGTDESALKTLQAAKANSDHMAQVAAQAKAKRDADAKKAKEIAAQKKKAAAKKPRIVTRKPTPTPKPKPKPKPAPKPAAPKSHTYGPVRSA